MSHAPRAFAWAHGLVRFDDEPPWVMAELLTTLPLTSRVAFEPSPMPGSPGSVPRVRIAEPGLVLAFCVTPVESPPVPGPGVQVTA